MFPFTQMLKIIIFEEMRLWHRCTNFLSHSHQFSSHVFMFVQKKLTVKLILKLSAFSYVLTEKNVSCGGQIL